MILISLLTGDTIDSGAGGLKFPPDVNLSFMASLNDLQTSLYTDRSVVTVVM